MRKMENQISDAMMLIENLAVNIQIELTNIEFEEMEDGMIEWVGSYELDSTIFRAFKEEAICDYFDDYLQDEIENIEQEYGVTCKIYIEDDELVVYFGNE